MERYRSIAELVRMSGIPRSTIYRAIEAGEIPVFTPNGSKRGWRVPEGAFAAWLEKRTARVA